MTDEEILAMTVIWFKAIDGMLVDMHTGDVLGPACLDGFGYRYRIPPRDRRAK